jgi:hypothetical protein
MIAGENATTRMLPMMGDDHHRKGHPFPFLNRASKGKLTSHRETPLVFFEVEPVAGPSYPVAVAADSAPLIEWHSASCTGLEPVKVSRHLEFGDCRERRFGMTCRTS